MTRSKALVGLIDIAFAGYVLFQFVLAPIYKDSPRGDAFEVAAIVCGVLAIALGAWSIIHRLRELREEDKP